MSNRREMSKWKKCKTCGQIMRLAFIYGRPCYKHPTPLSKAVCERRKAAAAEQQAEKRVDLGVRKGLILKEFLDLH